MSAVSSSVASLCAGINSAHERRNFEDLRRFGAELVQKLPKTPSLIIRESLALYNTCKAETTALRRRVLSCYSITNHTEAFEALLAITDVEHLPPIERFNFYCRTALEGQLYRKVITLTLEGSGKKVLYQEPRPCVTPMIAKALTIKDGSFPQTAAFEALFCKARIDEWVQNNHKSMTKETWFALWFTCVIDLEELPDSLWPLEIQLILAAFAEKPWFERYLSDIRTLLTKCRIQLIQNDSYLFHTSKEYLQVCLLRCEENIATYSHNPLLREMRLAIVEKLSALIELKEPLCPTKYKAVSLALRQRYKIYTDSGQQAKSITDNYNLLYLRAILKMGPSKGIVAVMCWETTRRIKELLKFIDMFLFFSMTSPDQTIPTSMLTEACEDLVALAETLPSEPSVPTIASRATAALPSPEDNTLILIEEVG